MPDNPFEFFPNWDNFRYREYWLRHNLSSDLWTDYSGADLYRALATAGRYVSENMFYRVRNYILGQSNREDNFASLDSDNGIPQSMYESEKYWDMKHDFLYTLKMTSYDEEGNMIITNRALGSNEPLTPQQLFDYADSIFNNSKYPGFIGYEDIQIQHAYKRPG